MRIVQKPRVFRFGFTPQGTPGSSPTGTTGFLHQPYIVGGHRNGGRYIRFGFTPLNSSGAPVVDAAIPNLPFFATMGQLSNR